MHSHTKQCCNAIKFLPHGLGAQNKPGEVQSKFSHWLKFVRCSKCKSWLDSLPTVVKTKLPREGYTTSVAHAQLDSLKNENKICRKPSYYSEPIDYTKYKKDMNDCIFEVSFHVFQSLDHSVRCSPTFHKVLSHDSLGTSWKTLRCEQAQVDEDGSVTKQRCTRKNK